MKNLKAATEEEINNLSRVVIKGWQNFYDSGTGEEIEYKADINGGADKDIWDSIPENVRATILQKAMSISGLVYLEQVGL